VKPTKVLYVAAEGEGGIDKRIRALRDKYGPSANFNFIAQPIDLLRNGGHKLEVIDAATATGAQLIVIDTLNRAIAGGDENSSQDMGVFIGSISDIKCATKAHVGVIHHGTKASMR
jgi:RecA-family ATPase